MPRSSQQETARNAHSCSSINPRPLKVGGAGDFEPAECTHVTKQIAQ
ncbi:MAG TPA: hypothetical protein H9987_00795 [Candidatus Luteococcus avicola]|nr:hypothetical protein [Candidatus Luteococcus avicola]